MTTSISCPCCGQRYTGHNSAHTMHNVKRHIEETHHYSSDNAMELLYSSGRVQRPTPFADLLAQEAELRAQGVLR